MGGVSPRLEDLLLLGGRIRGTTEPEDTCRSRASPRDVRRFDEARRGVPASRARALPQIPAKRGRVLHTSPCAQFARWILDEGLRDWDDLPVICGAEALPGDRACAASAFGPAIFETYGSRETMCSRTSRRPSPDASTLAISVLPVPGSPSRNSGLRIASARCTVVVSSRSATYPPASSKRPVSSTVRGSLRAKMGSAAT